MDEHPLKREDIQKFLSHLAQHQSEKIAVYLIGGSALALLGNPRTTLDIDLFFDPLTEKLKESISIVEQELKIEIEVVPLHEFIPLPPGAEERHLKITTENTLEIFIYDPYSIALSKIARGFDTDIQDVLFLLKENFIEIGKLAQFVKQLQPVAWDYDIDPSELEQYFNTLTQEWENL